MHRAIGRSLVAAAAMSLCLIAASDAATAAGTQASAGKPLVLVHTGKRHASKKSARLHQTDRKPAKAEVNKDEVKPASPTNETTEDQARTAKQSSLPPAIANAHAELTPGDMQANDSPATLAEPDKTAGIETASNGVQIAAADQFNDIDRDMITEAPVSAAPVQMAALPQAQTVIAQTISGQDDVWSRVALIGKILIGLGATLTLVSAARMLFV
ncbi:MAG: hypothetical protein K2X60_03165 [Xanthobacteraceae bacterium]|nr:hypothetical protein [Xanthobacteraceae bacterium]